MRDPLTFPLLICNQVLQWMDAHEDALPLQLKKPTTDAQRADSILRSRLYYLSRKTDHSPEVRALLDKISQQRSRRAARLTFLLCKKVLEWMDEHEQMLPALVRKPTTDAQRAELLLRRQYNYLRRSTNPSLELRAVLEEIESRTSFVLSATTTCKKVLEWMYGHQRALPREYRTPTTDAQRAEYLLRNQLKYLKRKIGQPPQVLALLHQIKLLSLQWPDSKHCLTVRPWCPSSDETEPRELPVTKRRRLLVKTKAPRTAR
jgi:hypothetical protein